MDKRPLKVFLCHIMPVGCAHADRDPVPQGDDMRRLPAGTRLTQDGVDRYAWLDKAKLLPGQGFDRLNLPDWELEIRKAVRETVA